ncbi:hypothetical protein [Chachezhania sediminis]|uniref:hypothetical protein n=1 Tax=Chachezhania sediminis TaxID=2599291 RepID=UPI00131CA394|nr:hypothetical protein [Chachezhania sediminis]
MTEHDRTPEQSTEIVANCVSDLILRLHKEAGIPLQMVIAAAHAEIVTEMALMVGGEMAYELCLGAGERVRPLLSVSDIALAASTPHGSA